VRAAEELEYAKVKADFVISLIGSVKDPGGFLIGTILSAIGIPSFSTTYNAPAKEAI
jgi:hypothetical protein